MRVNCLAKVQGPPVLLVHGFGASVAHWRRNIGVLSESYTVYTIDLLGFGASDNPPEFSYTMKTWAELMLDLMEEVVRMPTVLVGNSVGSLACVIAASAAAVQTAGFNLRADQAAPAAALADRLPAAALLLSQGNI